MPLSAAGKLSIVASADIGGLGAKEGSPVIYDWVLPGVASLLLPWLAILILLALKPNRCAAAWLIWLPVACLVWLTQAVPSMLPSGTEFFLDVMAALTAGLGAVWLLTDHLRRQHRFVTFMCILLGLAVFSALAFVTGPGWGLSSETFPAGIVLAVGVLANSVALSLAGLVCRKRYRPGRLYAWLLIFPVLVWMVIAVPFFLFALIASGGMVSWGEFFGPVFALVALNLATLLPFLILSSASPFFRERLKALLQVKAEAPAVIAPLPEAGLKV